MGNPTQDWLTAGEATVLEGTVEAETGAWYMDHDQGPDDDPSSYTETTSAQYHALRLLGKTVGGVVLPSDDGGLKVAVWGIPRYRIGATAYTLPGTDPFTCTDDSTCHLYCDADEQVKENIGSWPSGDHLKLAEATTVPEAVRTKAFPYATGIGGGAYIYLTNNAAAPAIDFLRMVNADGSVTHARGRLRSDGKISLIDANEVEQAVSAGTVSAAEWLKLYWMWGRADSGGKLYVWLIDSDGNHLATAFESDADFNGGSGDVAVELWGQLGTATNPCNIYLCDLYALYGVSPSLEMQGLVFGWEVLGPYQPDHASSAVDVGSGPLDKGLWENAAETGPNATRCQGLGLQGMYFVDHQPWFQVMYPEGTIDAEGGETWFNARGGGGWDPYGEFAKYKYLLNRHTVLLVDPCAPLNYCPFGEGTIWLCRIFFQGTASGWRMWCNSTEAGGYGAAQLADKPILIDLDVDYGLVFVHLTSGKPAPNCFSPLYDVQCFSSACDGESWECTSSTLAQNLNHLYIDLIDLHYSMDETAFARRNPYDIELKNAVWATLAPLVDQVDHNSSLPHNSPSMCEWRHVGQFADSPVVQGHPPSGSDEGDFPGAYADLEGLPIPLRARSFLTGKELPAVLTLKGVGIFLHLHVEEVVSIKDSDACGTRVFADIIIRALVRVKLLPEAYGFEGYPFELVGRPDGGTDDPYDLRVEDPDNPGQIHPVERLTVVGPHNERVPTQVYSGDVAAPVITIPHLSWRGLKTSRRFSRGPNEAVWIEELMGCCRAYRTIDGTVIFGELNDCSEFQTDGSAVIKPQRYQGGVVIHPWSLTGCGP